MREAGGDGVDSGPAPGQHIVTEETGSDKIREIIFEVTEAPEGGYDARALGHSVFTQGDDWDDLKEMVRDAVLCHFDDRETRRVIRLHCASGAGAPCPAPTRPDKGNAASPLG